MTPSSIEDMEDEGGRLHRAAQHVAFMQKLAAVPISPIPKPTFDTSQFPYRSVVEYYREMKLRADEEAYILRYCTEPKDSTLDDDSTSNMSQQYPQNIPLYFDSRDGRYSEAKFDIEDRVWRCTECGWEVETDDGVEGTCSRGHKFDCTGIVNFEPADEWLHHVLAASGRRDDLSEDEDWELREMVESGFIDDAGIRPERIQFGDNVYWTEHPEAGGHFQDPKSLKGELDKENHARLGSYSADEKSIDAEFVAEDSIEPNDEEMELQAEVRALEGWGVSEGSGLDYDTEAGSEEMEAIKAVHRNTDSEDDELEDQDIKAESEDDRDVDLENNIAPGEGEAQS